MWKVLTEVPKGIYVTRLSDPLNYGEYVWAEVVPYSAIDDILIFVRDINEIDTVYIEPTRSEER